MSKFSRRSLFPLAAVGAVVAVDGAQGASIDPTGMPGLIVRMAKTYDGWCVLVADLDSMNGYWRPGMSVPTKWMPITEYLELIDQTYSI